MTSKLKNLDVSVQNLEVMQWANKNKKFEQSSRNA